MCHDSRVTPLVAGLFLLVFVGVALGVIALTGNKRLQWILVAAATALLLAAAVLSRFW
jgi:hypothetical protein